MAHIGPEAKSHNVFRARIIGSYSGMDIRVESTENDTTVHGNLNIGRAIAHAVYGLATIVCAENPLFKMPLEQFTISDEHLLPTYPALSPRVTLDDILQFAVAKGPMCPSGHIDNLWFSYWQVLILQQFLNEQGADADNALRYCDALVFKRPIVDLRDPVHYQMVTHQLKRPADVVWVDDAPPAFFSCKLGELHILAPGMERPTLLISVDDFFEAARSA